MGAHIAVLACGLNKVVDIFNRILALLLRAYLDQCRAGILVLDVVAIAGIVVDNGNVVRILGEQIDVHLGQIGIVLALGLTDVGFVAGQHQEIVLGHIGMIAGCLMVGDAENRVAVILVGFLQLGGGQLTVGNGAVAMQVCLVLGLILLDVSNHSVPLFAKKT